MAGRLVTLSENAAVLGWSFAGAFAFGLLFALIGPKIEAAIDRRRDFRRVVRNFYTDPKAAAVAYWDRRFDRMFSSGIPITEIRKRERIVKETITAAELTTEHLGQIVTVDINANQRVRDQLVGIRSEYGQRGDAKGKIRVMLMFANVAPNERDRVMIYDGFAFLVDPGAAVRVHGAPITPPTPTDNDNLTDYEG